MALYGRLLFKKSFISRGFKGGSMKMVKFFIGFLVVVTAQGFAQELPEGCPDLLFVQSIENASFENGTLKLNEASDLVLYFSERPNRLSGHMTLNRFLKLWEDGKNDFSKNPPNAVLSILSDSTCQNVVLELLSPKMQDDVLCYSTKVLSGTVPTTFTDASLFIDAFPTSVNSVNSINSINSQITDAVTQTNVKVLGEAPVVAMGSLFQATAQALGNAAHNATTAQQQTNVTAQAATTQGIITLYSIDTASTGKATEKILESD